MLFQSGMPDTDKFIHRLRKRASSSNSELRCTLISECIQQLKSGSKNVYADVSLYHFILSS